jgi:2-polyprenyl-3-methyl-5-hydroxy-6-metoxy-1,4-benzoquinol methylase
MRKAREPTHPKHLIAAPSHAWCEAYLEPTDRLLDAGCATGNHTIRAARIVTSALGVDRDERALAQARRESAAAGLTNTRFEQCDLEDPGSLRRVLQAPFDAVLLLDVLEHVSHRRQLLRAIHALLTPAGRLLVAVPNYETPYKQWRRRLGAHAYADRDHKVEYDEAAIRAELAEAGFRVVRLERSGYDSPFAGFAALLGAFSLAAYRRVVERRTRLGRERPAAAAAFRILAVPADLDS